MEQVFAWITRMEAEPETGEIRFLYDVVIKKDTEKLVRYSCDHPIDLARSIDENVTSVKEKIAADAVYRGYKITSSDVDLPIQMSPSKDLVNPSIQPLLGELPEDKGLWARSVDYVKSLWS